MPILRLQTSKKLFTPNIEKALTFLDDSQLPSTSNAVVALVITILVPSTLTLPQTYT